MTGIDRLIVLGRKAMPLLILVFGLGMTAFLYAQTKSADDRRVHDTIDLRSTWRARDLQHKFLAMADPIDALAGFMFVSGDIATDGNKIYRDEFRRFAVIAKGTDSIARLLWAPLVSSEMRAGYEAAVRQEDESPVYAISERGPDARMAPAGARDQYLPVRFEDRFEGDPALRGFDLMSNPTIRDAAERARDSGTAIASVPIAPFLGNSSVRRYVVLKPIFTGGLVPATVEERQASIIGYVAGTFPLVETFNAAVRNTPQIVETLSLFVNQPSNQPFGVPEGQYRPDTDKVLVGLDTLSNPLPDAMRVTKSFDELGLAWTFVFDFAPDVVAQLRSPARWNILGGGLALSIILAAYVLALQRRQSVVEALVVERTRELHSNAAQLATIIQSSPLPTIASDKDMKVTVWNRAAERVFGFSSAEVVGAERSLIPSGREAEYSDVMARLQNGETMNGVEMLRQRKDGSTIETAVSGGAYRDSDGVTQGFIFTIEDITERKRLELVEREITERLRVVVDTGLDGTILIDADGTAILFSPPAERMFGYRADEVLGHNIKMLMPAPFTGEHDGYLGNYLRTGERKVIGIGRDAFGRRKDGTTFPMHLVVAEARENGRRIFVGVVHDLTGQHASEQTLRRSQEHLARAQAVASIGSTEIDLGTKEEIWSDEVYRFLRVDRDSTERNVDSFAAAVHPDDRALVRDVGLRERNGEEVDPIEFRVIGLDGTIR